MEVVIPVNSGMLELHGYNAVPSIPSANASGTAFRDWSVLPVLYGRSPTHKQQNFTFGEALIPVHCLSALLSYGTMQLGGKARSNS